MSYSNCSLLGKLLPKRIAYTDDNLNILTYLLSLDNLFSKRVTGKVNHSRITWWRGKPHRCGPAAPSAEPRTGRVHSEAVRCYEAAISTAERAGEKAILAEALRRLAVVLHHRNESARRATS